MPRRVARFAEGRLRPTPQLAGVVALASMSTGCVAADRSGTVAEFWQTKVGN